MPAPAKIDSVRDFTPVGLGELKAWLEPWFLNRGGVTVTQKRLVACWAGSVPTVIGNGLTWRIPYDPLDDSTLAFTLNRSFLRIETVATSSVQVRVETSPGGNSAFVATTFDTLTVPAASYEDDNTGLAASISSGSLVRIVFVAVPGTVVPFQVQVSGVTS